MSMADNALSAKAKAMFGRRLSDKDYLELLKKRSVAEVCTYLKAETEYGKSLKDVHDNSIHRGQLEKLLRQNMFERLLQLYRYSSKKQETFYRMTLKLIEIDLILDRIRAIQSNDFSGAIADMPLYIDAFTEVHLDEFIAVRNFDDMLKVLQPTMYYKVFKNYDMHDKKLDYTKLETDLHKLYYEHVFETIDKLFKGRVKKDLHMLYATNVELSNITKLYRYKKFYHDEQSNVRNALIDYQSRLSPSMMETMIAAPDVKSLLSLLAKSPYRLFIDVNDYVYIEYYAHQVKYNAAKHYMYFTTAAPLVFSAFQELLELEVNNLITIIEGVRYKIPSDDIEQMLIY